MCYGSKVKWLLIKCHLVYSNKIIKQDINIICKFHNFLIFYFTVPLFFISNYYFQDEIFYTYQNPKNQNTHSHIISISL